ncbi:hypothetical protein Pint_26523 [Pistacia integerrima]|uniref:Uncharacterized protein n=1 Tax=Pistacia integerrima TaxID=434235 RepID=A0ACC0YD31_9ROSI|nr:hypothetical protein Pint_26523 [Pistacia integerrima]
MSLPVSAPPASPKNAEQYTNRPYANFHPSIWGDHFLSYATNSVVKRSFNLKVLVTVSHSNGPAQHIC